MSKLTAKKIRKIRSRIEYYQHWIPILKKNYNFKDFTIRECLTNYFVDHLILDLDMKTAVEMAYDYADNKI